MITVKNRLNQPLIVNVPDSDSVYFLDKEIKEITQEQYDSPDMKSLINDGFILVLRMS